MVVSVTVGMIVSTVILPLDVFMVVLASAFILDNFEVSVGFSEAEVKTVVVKEDEESFSTIIDE